MLRNLSYGKNPRPLPGPPRARCPAKLCIRIPHTGSSPGPHLCVCGPPWWVARYVGSEPGMVLYLGCSRWSICRTLPGPPASPGGCWTRGPDQGTGLRGFLALPPPQFLRFSVLGPAPPSLAADVVSFLGLGLQLGTAAVLGAPGASAAPAAPGVARAARAAPLPRDDSPAAVTMTTAVR